VLLVLPYTICFAMSWSRFPSACFDDRQNFVLSHDEVLLTIEPDCGERARVGRDSGSSRTP
jgi:hypothetical protein